LGEGEIATPACLRAEVLRRASVPERLPARSVSAKAGLRRAGTHLSGARNDILVNVFRFLNPDAGVRVQRIKRRSSEYELLQKRL